MKTIFTIVLEVSGYYRAKWLLPDETEVQWFHAGVGELSEEEAEQDVRQVKPDALYRAPKTFVLLASILGIIRKHKAECEEEAARFDLLAAFPTWHVSVEATQRKQYAHSAQIIMLQSILDEIEQL